MPQGKLPLVVTLLAATLCGGCAASSAGDEDVDDGAGAFVGSSTPALPKDAVAVEVTVDRGGSPAVATIGLPSKLAAIAASLKDAPRGRQVSECTNSQRDRYRALTLRFLDANGMEVATASVSCSGDGTLKTGKQVRRIVAGGELDATLSKPYAIGDTLWGITEIKVYDLSNSSSPRAVTEGSELSRWMADLNVAQPLRPNSTTDRMCPAGHHLEFRRAGRIVADAALLCMGDSPAPAHAQTRESTFAARGPNDRVNGPPAALGRITVDARRVLALFSSR